MKAKRMCWIESVISYNLSPPGPKKWQRPRLKHTREESPTTACVEGSHLITSGSPRTVLR